MLVDRLFTIILLNYNQEKYIYEALDSILKQDYKNLELIIADDSSVIFEKNKISKYLKTKNDKLTFFFMENRVNQGTVKTVNNAIKKAHGEYILIFAADDKLYDDKVISNFSDFFKKNKDYNILTAQCCMFDKDMKKNNYDFVNIDKALSFNKQDSSNQFKMLSKSCLFAAGATAYRKCVFEKYGTPKEEYKLIEDLTYWLYLTKSGEKMKYVDFFALKHRDGGVSSNTTLKGKVPRTIQLYYLDILKMYELEIFPSIKKFKNHEKQLLYSNYLDAAVVLSSYDKTIIKDKKKYVFKLYLKDISYFLFKMWCFLKRRVKTILRMIKRHIKLIYKKKNVLIMLLVWLILNYFILNTINLKFNSFALMFFNYFIARILTWSIKLLYSYRWCRA